MNLAEPVVVFSIVVAAALVVALLVTPVGPTLRAALVLGAAALSALVLPIPLVALIVVGVLSAIVTDALMARSRPRVEREVAAALSRGVASPLLVRGRGPAGARLRFRQPRLPDVRIEPAEADGLLEAELVPRRRGRHTLPGAAVRVTGPLGLAAWVRPGTDPAELLVFPDLPAARRLALAVRTGKFREPGRVRRGPLGLGTDFESIREYLPDDDVRQVNWRATARTGRPMSNQFRLEQDRDLICLVDCGRLMAAPLGDRTRLDAAVDAVAAVAFVADEVGDRVGVVAFDDEVRRRIRPRRSGGDAVVRAVFDLEPRTVDADYELAFRAVGSAKRAFVLVFTDLLDEAAARFLLDAIPLLSRRHALVVASVVDPDIERALVTPPARLDDVFAAAAALDLAEARRTVTARLQRLGSEVLEAPPDGLSAACVGAYLRAKRHARL